MQTNFRIVPADLLSNVLRLLSKTKNSVAQSINASSEFQNLGRLKRPNSVEGFGDKKSRLAYFSKLRALPFASENLEMGVVAVQISQQLYSSS